LREHVHRKERRLWALCAARAIIRSINVTRLGIASHFLFLTAQFVISFHLPVYIPNPSKFFPHLKGTLVTDRHGAYKKLIASFSARVDLPGPRALTLD
jgi:hypothetical protein